MRLFLASLLAALAVADTASAQYSRVVPPPPTFPAGEGPVERARQDTFRDDQTGAGGRARREQQERERISTERARRLAALVNAGQCREAHRIALAEGDPAMAQRIATVCSGGE